MPRKVTRGTGITAYEMTVYDVQKEALPRNWGDNWNQAIKEGGGIFGAVALQAERTCEHILAGSTDDAPLEDSPEDFARQIAKMIRVAKHEIEQAAEAGHKGNADRAARYAFVAGMKWAQATLKWAWEADALRGEKVAGGLKNSAHETNAKHDKVRAARFARMAELVPRIGVDKAAAQCEIDGLGTQSAVKRQWNRFQTAKKKRDT